MSSNLFRVGFSFGSDVVEGKRDVCKGHITNNSKFEASSVLEEIDHISVGFSLFFSFVIY